jgi:hypothetical protein
LVGAIATVAVAVAGGLATLSAPDWKAQRDRRRQVRELEARYSDSLRRSADALQSRFWNVAMLRFSQAYVQRGTDEERFHAITSTLWLVGQYFCWVELLRRDAYSLALGGVERGRRLLALLERIEELFASDAFKDQRFRLWRAEQSALGELMIVERAADHARHFDCLGYATFVDKLQKEQFKRWFVPLEDTLTGVETPPERLAHLQNALVDLVEFLYGGEVPGRERIDLRN